MKAIIATESGSLFTDVEEPTLREASDVCVRVCAAAICRTDLYAAQGRLPVASGRVLGHEFTGVVESVGEESRFAPGDRVVANPSFSCRRCSDCLKGDHHLCADTRFLGLDLDGAFAERVVVPDTALFPLVDDVSFTVGTFAEPVAAGMAIFEANLQPSDRILIAGAGRIAELTGRLLASAGFNSFETARFENVGSTDLYDVIIETGGLSANSTKALELLVPGGMLVVKSRYPDVVSIPVLKFIRRRIRIVAVNYGRFENALEFVRREVAALEAGLDTVWRLEDHERAFDIAGQSEERKCCFRVSD